MSASREPLFTRRDAKRIADAKLAQLKTREPRQLLTEYQRPDDLGDPEHGLDEQTGVAYECLVSAQDGPDEAVTVTVAVAPAQAVRFRGFPRWFWAPTAVRIGVISHRADA